MYKNKFNYVPTLALVSLQAEGKSRVLLPLSAPLLGSRRVGPFRCCEPDSLYYRAASARTFAGALHIHMHRFMQAQLLPEAVLGVRNASGAWARGLVGLMQLLCGRNPCHQCLVLYCIVKFIRICLRMKGLLRNGHWLLAN